jgi:hypothetical protein
MYSSSELSSLTLLAPPVNKKEVNGRLSGGKRGQGKGSRKKKSLCEGRKLCSQQKLTERRNGIGEGAQSSDEDRGGGGKAEGKERQKARKGRRKGRREGQKGLVARDREQAVVVVAL